MSNFKEVLFIADENDPASSVDCFDLQLGTKIGMYPSGHGVVRGSLQILNEEYFMSAEICKPPLRGSSNIHIWSIDTRNQVKRISVAGEITALGVSADNFYCAAGVNNKILLWNIASGQLLNTISYHHEPITKILFWNCSYFITCGADGLVAIWRLADVISKETGDPGNASHLQAPFFASSKHSLPVTDMYVAPAGNTCRLFTVSADQNCHVFSVGLNSGRYILALTYDFVLTSVICDHLQRNLYVGTTCGRVVLFSLEYKTGPILRHVGDENSLVGHAGAVRALSITQEDDLLATGSEDKKVIVWNVLTRQQIHTCEMHGHISNLLFHVVKGDFLSPGPPPKTIVSNFERNVLANPYNLEIKLCVKNELTYEDDVSALEDIFVFQRGMREWKSVLGRSVVRSDEESESEGEEEEEEDEEEDEEEEEEESEENVENVENVAVEVPQIVNENEIQIEAENVIENEIEMENVIENEIEMEIGNEMDIGSQLETANEVVIGNELEAANEVVIGSEVEAANEPENANASANANANANANGSESEIENEKLEDVDDSDTDTDVEILPEDNWDDEPTTAVYKRLVKLKNQVAELRATNRQLKRVNKKLYIFGLEQVWQRRNIRDLNN